MSAVTITKDQWVEVLEAAGVDHEGRIRWHREFERRYPDSHQAFLQWLDLPDSEIAQIREMSRR